MDKKYYSPSYGESFALIIGINKYSKAPNLEYAFNDAEAVASLLKDRFDFKDENIKLLLNEKATRQEIMSSFLSYAKNGVSVDDRVIVFFAGHGTTQTGSRGEVGFLVPYDGDSNDLSSLIRWDELMRNSELIEAKHVLFIMDACYGGLALTRTLPSGSMRFLKDMLQRKSRQVLTAGKADETVSDSGGPIPEHSIFTGHFLEGLQGKAASDEGVITANGIMAYVYDHVSKDPNSYQTPHYGFFDGDGDFIFKAPGFEKLKTEGEVDEDILVAVPTTSVGVGSLGIDDVIIKTKEYLSDSRYKIRLYDLFNQKLREVVALLNNEQFHVQGTFSENELLKRIGLYEEAMNEIKSMVTCVAHWGDKQHIKLLNQAVARICDNIKPESGSTTWINLKWYPVFLLVYSAGISAIAANNFDALSVIFDTKVPSSNNSNESLEIKKVLGDAAADLHSVFKSLPGHERNYVPRSEYLLKLLQPNLDDLLFLGRDYVKMFDRFEAFFALIYADQDYHSDSQAWAPVGRFAYNYRGRGTDDVFGEIMAEAAKFQNEWPPLKAGLFLGSIDRFHEVSRGVEAMLKDVRWR